MDAQVQRSLWKEWVFSSHKTDYIMFSIFLCYVMFHLTSKREKSRAPSPFSDSMHFMAVLLLLQVL